MSKHVNMNGGNCGWNLSVLEIAFLFTYIIYTDKLIIVNLFFEIF